MLNDTIQRELSNNSFWNRTQPRIHTRNAKEELIKSIFLAAYIIVFVIGLAGNSLTCYVIIKKRFMRKAIHFYTLNMAIADLVVILFYVPVEIIKNEHDMVWTMGEAICRINYCIIPLSLAASICTLVAITINRHRGVTKPLKWRGDTRSIVKISIPLVWLAGVITCIPFMFVVVLKEFPPGSGIHYCYEDWGNRYSERAYWITMFCLQVILPLIIMIFLNAHMLLIMNRYDLRHKSNHKRIIRMVVVLVVVYAVCTSPQHVVYFWLTYGNLTTIMDVDTQKIVFKIANLLLIIQIAVNPIIYGTLGELRPSFSKVLTLSRFKAVLSFRQTKTTQEDIFSRGSHSPDLDYFSPVTYRDGRYDLDI